MHNLLPTVCTMLIEEHEIRSTLITLLDASRQGNSKVWEEFRIERGGSRIDVAMIGDELIGYEIKSDKDTFVRFSNQIHAYNRVFDRINLVCGPALTDQAVEVVPSWWGIVIAGRDSADIVHLTVMRAASANPKQNAFSLASLLWKEEAAAVLSSAEASTPKTASVHTLWDCMAKNFTVEAIRTVVTESLLKRQHYSDLVVKTM
ncbi:MAG: sce7726 family protein [Ferrovum myxofaciens]